MSSMLIKASRRGVNGWLDVKSGRFAPALAGCDPVGEADLKDKLKRIEDDISSLRDDRAAKAKARDEAKQAFAQIDGYDVEAPEFKAAQDAVKSVGEIDDKIAEAQSAQVGILKMLGQSDPAEARKSRDREPERGKAQDGWNTAGLFDGNDTLKAQLAQIATTKSRFGSIDLGQVADREALKAVIGGTTDMRLAPYGGVLPQIYRPLRVLDLLATGTIDGNNLPYTQEGGTFTAAETAEGSAKPEGGVTFTDANAPVQTIAAWQKLKKQAVEDFAALQSIIDGRLRYSVRRRLETQVLSGDGSGSNLTGILNTSGIGTVAYTNTVPLAELVLSGITKVFLSDAEATGIVLNPNDWQTMVTGKASGSGEYFSGGPFQVTPQVLWGVACLPSPAVAQGTALVGDFEIGASVLIRSGVNVLMSDSDQDDFIKNQLTLLGEMRAALPVWRPAAFCKVALA